MSHNIKRGLAPLGVLAILCVIAARPAYAQSNGPTPEQRGRVMFVRQWTEKDEKTPLGDGLGPMFNARSCVACHNQGGVGGSGSLARNVDVLSVILPENLRQLRTKGQFNVAKFTDSIKEMHAGLMNASGGVRTSITLHRFGTSPGYAAWRDVLVDSLHENDTSMPNGQVHFQLTQRRAPSLFGAGLIDSIPKEAIADLARQKFAQKGPIKGMISSGKFGWRGQTADLRSFVRGACANELGLRVPRTDQARNPLNPTLGSPGDDLTDPQCDDLAAFVASLPAPKQRKSWNQEEHSLWQDGSRLFTKVGCADCHVQKLAKVEGLYSDLLLHDMGQELSDPVASSRRSAEYYGAEDDVFLEVTPLAKRQWRTPPLWAAGVSGPYLHDGRAPTLDGAILSHGGEAETARKNYATLPPADRAKILAFLESLGSDLLQRQLASR